MTKTELERLAVVETKIDVIVEDIKEIKGVLKGLTLGSVLTRYVFPGIAVVVSAAAFITR